MKEKDSITGMFSLEYSRVEETMALCRQLLLEEYPPSIVEGLRIIANALIEAQGFEGRFCSFVDEATYFIRKVRSEESAGQ